MSIPNEYITRIRQHALDHYDQDGWDYLVEAITDDELTAPFKGKDDWTYEAFFIAVHLWVRVLNSKRNDVLGEVF